MLYSAMAFHAMRGGFGGIDPFYGQGYPGGFDALPKPEEVSRSPHLVRNFTLADLPLIPLLCCDNHSRGQQHHMLRLILVCVGFDQFVVLIHKRGKEIKNLRVVRLFFCLQAPRPMTPMMTHTLLPGVMPGNLPFLQPPAPVIMSTPTPSIVTATSVQPVNPASAATYFHTPAGRPPAPTFIHTPATSIPMAVSQPQGVVTKSGPQPVTVSNTLTSQPATISVSFSQPVTTPAPVVRPGPIVSTPVSYQQGMFSLGVSQQAPILNALTSSPGPIVSTPMSYPQTVFTTGVSLQGPILNTPVPHPGPTAPIVNVPVTQPIIGTSVVPPFVNTADSPIMTTAANTSLASPVSVVAPSTLPAQMQQLTQYNVTQSSMVPVSLAPVSTVVRPCTIQLNNNAVSQPTTVVSTGNMYTSVAHFTPAGNVINDRGEQAPVDKILRPPSLRDLWSYSAIQCIIDSNFH